MKPNNVTVTTPTTNHTARMTVPMSGEPKRTNSNESPPAISQSTINPATRCQPPASEPGPVSGSPRSAPRYSTSTSTSCPA
ncbi:Uncharacterised protein [Mycobacteroides abscessus subsp. abscessus]|nr:Uncharacterised protein [Mycobacteroides abscessus subsp. abscessus]